MDKTITYRNAEITVTSEVAEFLEQDKKREEAQKKSDRRHLSKSIFEQIEATAETSFDDSYIFGLVNKNLKLKKLGEVMEKLSEDEKQLIYLYYSKEFSMEKIGEIMGGVTKMAISKRLKKLLFKMRNLMET